MDKLLRYLTPVLLVVILVVLLLGGGGTAIGGDTNFDSLDVTDGYKVDGTTIIDGDGNIDGVITSTTGTFSSTLGVSGLISATGGVSIDESSLGWGGAFSPATTTEGAILTAAQVCDNAVITINPDWNDYTTTTLPFASALIADCMGTVGDTRQIVLRNTSAGTSTQILASGTYATGTEVYSASGTEAIAAGAYAVITFHTASTTGTEAFLDNYQ